MQYKYRFIERDDAGEKVIAIVTVSNEGVSWKGSGADAMQVLLANTKWRLLGDVPFNETKDEHWRKLPKLISGGRLWVEEA